MYRQTDNRKKIDWWMDGCMDGNKVINNTFSTVWYLYTKITLLLHEFSQPLNILSPSNSSWTQYNNTAHCSKQQMNIVLYPVKHTLSQRWVVGGFPPCMHLCKAWNCSSRRITASYRSSFISVIQKLEPSLALTSIQIHLPFLFNKGEI